jgi:hypothetical protein
VNLQEVAQTSGNNWTDLYSFQRAYRQPKTETKRSPGTLLDFMPQADFIPQYCSGSEVRNDSGIVSALPSQLQGGTNLPNGGVGLVPFDDLEKGMAGFKASQEATAKELQHRFGMASDAKVLDFLANHRSLPHLLTEAFDRLQDAFGAGTTVNLEVSTDEDGYQTLYAVTLWKNAAPQAAIAFDSFVENWWIHRMSAATSDIAFVYRLI